MCMHVYPRLLYVQLRHEGNIARHEAPFSNSNCNNLVMVRHRSVYRGFGTCMWQVTTCETQTCYLTCISADTLFELLNYWCLSWKFDTRLSENKVDAIIRNSIYSFRSCLLRLNKPETFSWARMANSWGWLLCTGLMPVTSVEAAQAHSENKTHGMDNPRSSFCTVYFFFSKFNRLHN